MIQIIKHPSPKSEAFLKRLSERVKSFPTKLEDYVKKIGREVQKKGDLALAEFTERFDKVKLRPEDFWVKEDEFKKAYEEISEELLSAIRLAIKQVREFHERGLLQSWIASPRRGVWYGQLVKPVERAGLYVPGGTGGEIPLISTVIMTAVPAKIAGVHEVILVSPPRKDGSLHPALLVSAKEVGVDAVYRIGGPWSIFALAYGTETLPKVDLICGPGNIYVTLAKKIVSFHTGIDLIAGPSEVVVVADETARADFVCWDLLAQAEHDPNSLSILITNSQNLAKEVRNYLREALKGHPRKDVALTSLKKKGAILLVPSLEEALAVANKIAPEHLELMVERPEEFLFAIQNAGAVFLGNYTPEALGDYIAGPNHVLPTMGFARFASSLSVEKFCKKINFLHYTEEALKKEAKKVIILAEAENLPAHAEAVRRRLKKPKEASHEGTL